MTITPQITSGASQALGSTGGCIIDLGSPCQLPFEGAERLSSPEPCVVRLELRDDILFLDDVPITLFLSEEQKKGGHFGYDLGDELVTRGGNVSAKVLDHLVAQPELWPKSWETDAEGKMIRVFFWADVFGEGAHGNVGIRCGWKKNGRVVSNYFWVGCRWFKDFPAASLAS